VPLNNLQLSSLEVIGEVMSVGADRRVSIGVDSGAGITVWPTHLYSDYPTEQTPESRAGVEYAGAGTDSKGIVNRGLRRYRLLSEGGRQLDMKANVCDVRKPLLSVADMNDQGMDVYFFADRSKGAMAIKQGTNEGIKIKRVNNVFEIDAEVLPWSGGGRQGQNP